MTEDREALFHKVRSLLKKAESTPYEEEAALFFAKAQELVVKYAIDEEALWKNDPTRRQEIVTTDIEIKDRAGGADSLRMIMHQVATNSRCRMWYAPGQSRSTLAGFSSDVIFAEMLFASIRAHLNFKYAMALANGKTSHPKTFRNSFCAGYADRIIERLSEQLKNQNEWLRQQISTEGTSTDLVIRDRKQKVDDWVNDNIRLGRARRASTMIKDRAAAGAGRVAADTADISGGRGGHLRTQSKRLGSGS